MNARVLFLSVALVGCGFDVPASEAPPVSSPVGGAGNGGGGGQGGSGGASATSSSAAPPPPCDTPDEQAAELACNVPPTAWCVDPVTGGPACLPRSCAPDTWSCHVVHGFACCRP